MRNYPVCLSAFGYSFVANSVLRVSFTRASVFVHEGTQEGTFWSGIRFEATTEEADSTFSITR